MTVYNAKVIYSLTYKVCVCVCVWNRYGPKQILSYEPKSFGFGSNFEWVLPFNLFLVNIQFVP